jgi:hypothetical protein
MACATSLSSRLRSEQSTPPHLRSEMITLICYRVITRVHALRSRSTAKDGGSSARRTLIALFKQAGVAGNLGPIGPIPANEGVARELAGNTPARGRAPASNPFDGRAKNESNCLDGYESGIRIFLWRRPLKGELGVDCQEAHVFCPRSGFFLESPIQSESAVGVRLTIYWPYSSSTFGEHLFANGDPSLRRGNEHASIFSVMRLSTRGVMNLWPWIHPRLTLRLVQSYDTLVIEFHPRLTDNHEGNYRPAMKIASDQS